MTYSKKRLVWFGGILAMGILLSGCGKADPTELVETPSILTNVYTGTPITPPEHCEIKNYLGSIGGAYAFQCWYEDVTGEEGTPDFRAVTKDILYMLPIDADGTIHAEEASEKVVREKTVDGGYMSFDDRAAVSPSRAYGQGAIPPYPLRWRKTTARPVPLTI